MKICAKCQRIFPKFLIIDGKKRNFQRRKYCLSCSPFGNHNTQKLEIIKNKKNSYNSKKEKNFLKRFSKKQKLIDLFGSCCQSCGYKKNIAALGFHHIDPKTKKITLDVGTIGNRSWDLILKESKKCKLLCSNCHMEQHYPHLNLGREGFEPTTYPL